MNFYDVLAAKNWDGGIPTINFFDLLFAQSMGGAEQWETYEGTLPATINANGDNMRQYQVYGATGGVGDRTRNIFPSAAEQTITLNGVTATCDGKGKYIFTGTATQETTFSFDLTSSITFPLSTSQGGMGTFSLFNSKQYSSGGVIKFYNGSTAVDTWNLYPINRATLAYTAMSEKTVNRILFAFGTNVNTNCLVAPMITNDGKLPTSYEPYGYKLDMGVKSGNLFDKNATDASNGYVVNSGLYADGSTASYNNFNISEYILISANQDYVFKNLYGNTAAFCIYDSNKQYIWGEAYANRTTLTFNSGNNASYIRFNIKVYINMDTLMLTPGTTPPGEYQPYSNTTTPIYIGDEPLEEDEHVDYQAQKIYRMIDGTLTPTDPPLPLQALPTCEGTTIVDYAGQGTAPEKVYFEYN